MTAADTTRRTLGLIGVLLLGLVLTYTVWPKHDEKVIPRYEVVQTCMSQTGQSQQWCDNIVEGYR